MSSSIVDAESILAIEVGSVQTRALLLDVVEGQYRFIAAGVSPNTVQAPFNDLSEGVHRAILNLQEISGRIFFDASTLIIPGQTNGTGVDHLVVVYSAVPDFRMVVTGLLEQVSLESAERLAATTYGRVLEVIGLNDPRRREAQLDAILRAQPHLIILAGGTEMGASRSVMRVAELVLMLCRLLPQDKRPEVFYAGNAALSKRLVEGLQKWTTTHIAPNIRPGIDMEDLGPAQDSLAQVVTQMRMRQMNGLKDLSEQCATPPLPAANAFGRMIQFLSQIYDPNKGVLGVDVGASSTVIAAGLSGKLALNVSPFGVGAGLRSLAAQSSVEDFTRWLPMHVPTDVVKDYLAQKALYPASIPANVETLAIEQSITRRALSLAMQQTQARWQDLGSSFEPILASGAALRQAPFAGQSLLMLLDGLQPMGITTLVLDQNGLLPALGALAKFNAVLPVQVLESGTFLNLGTVIAPLCDVRYGTPILRVRLEVENGGELRAEVRQGTLISLPLKTGQTGTIHFQPLRQMMLDPRRAVGSTSFRIMGGLCGVVIDARGRPIQLPKDAARRRDLLKKWAAAVGC
jgi:hypothetical protein